MAELRRLAYGSSQIFVFRLEDKNRWPIDPMSVHIEGEVTTDETKVPYKFSCNKGVCVGCSIDRNMIAMTVMPLLMPGKVRVNTKTYIESARMAGEAVILANSQVINIQIMRPNEFVSDQQDAICDSISLPINIDLSAAGKPDAADEQWVRTETEKVLKSILDPRVAAAVSAAIKSVVTSENLAKNDLEDVDLPKLLDKGIDAKLAAADMSNVTAADYNRKLREDASFQALSRSLHPATKGRTVEDIRKMFYTDRHEVQQAVDFAQDDYKDATTLLMVYQITRNGQKIVQTLPSYALNKVVLVDVIYSTGITSGSVEIRPPVGEGMEGVTTKASVVISEEGHAGVFYPLQNEQSWEYWPYSVSNGSEMSIQDKRGNIVPKFKKLIVGNGMFLEYDDTTGEVTLKMDDMQFMFYDGMLKQSFRAKLLKSTDRSARIAMIKTGEDPDGNPIYEADISIPPRPEDEGIFATLGRDMLLNTAFPDARLWFANLVVPGGVAVYPDMQKKSFVLQDIDPQDDPNVSGGTTFLVGLRLTSNRQQNILTQKGYIRIELADDKNQPLMDINGNPAGAQIDFEAGDEQGEEYYFGEVQFKAYTDVHLRIETDFAQEEFLSAGADTAVVFQPIGKTYSMGKALLAFMAYTGYRPEVLTKYYGQNNMNLARVLVKPMAETDATVGEQSFGENLFVDFAAPAKVEITSDYKLVIKDNGADLPIFSIYKRYDRYDSHVLRGKQYTVTPKIQDKNNAYTVALMKYTGTEAVAPKPSVTGYQNSQPQFRAGWSVADSMFISEDAVSGIHTQKKTFTIPDDAKEFAIVMYPQTSQIPTTLILADLEGDITPWFNRAIVRTASHVAEQYLEKRTSFAKFRVDTPAGYVSYRYTVNKADTKVPLGVKVGSASPFKNNNDWADAGAIDPNKVQGSLLCEEDAVIKDFTFTAQVGNEQGTVNDVKFRLVKVAPDGSYTDVPGSQFATTIENGRKSLKKVTSPMISFAVKQGEVYRVIANSNKDDGFFLKSKTDGVPMFVCSFEYEAVEEGPTISNLAGLTFVKAGKPVADPGKYELEVDVDSGVVKVKGV